MSEPRPRAASIRDVARLAGVSHQTVSRVLNGYPGVREETRTRVLAAIGELGFRPSRAGRMLSIRRSETIGVLADATGASDYGPASCVRAVANAAREHGFYATVAHLSPVSPDVITAADELLGQDVEGIVIVAPRAVVLSGLAALGMNLPIVCAQGQQEDTGGIPVASVDQQAGVRMVMRYLIERGHERILHLAGPAGWNEAQARLRSYESELRAAGLPVLPPVRGHWTSDSGYETGRGIARRVTAGEVTAVFSSNDQMALGLLHAFREAGLDVPRDVSVAGFDDIPESAYFWPPITTVRQDFGELGKRCVALLVDAIRGRRSGEELARMPPVIVAPRLIIRGSVAAPPAVP